MCRGRYIQLYRRCSMGPSAFYPQRAPHHAARAMRGRAGVCEIGGHSEREARRVMRRRLSIVVALAAMVGGTFAGCGGTGCLLNAVAGLHVTILDGPGGAPLCGVTVTASDGAYFEALAESPGGAPCYYYGATER